MELDTRHQNKDESVVSEFARGLYHSAIQQPIDGVRQLMGAHVDIEDERSASLAYKAGGMAGFIVDFTVLSKVTGVASGRLFKSSSRDVFALKEIESSSRLAPIAQSSANMGFAGAIYGGILTPSSNEKGLLQGRLENGLVSGASFAVMGGVGKTLEPLELLGKRPLLNSIGNNAIAGGAGGAISSLGSIYFSEHRLATPSEFATTVAENALFGAGFGALGHGIGNVANHPKVSEIYYDAKWKLREAGTDAKRTYYGALNELDMRHPISKIGDLITGSKSLLKTERPQLTNENNPALALERELPQYYDRAAQMEEKLDKADHRSRYDQFKEAREVRAQFGERLLKWWHGNETEPGFKHYSDSELATPEMPVERVAEMRAALTQEGRKNSIGEALANLAKRENDSSNDVLDGIEMAKERFYKYDERALSKKMAMPSEHFVKDRDGLSPMSWMPFEGTDKLANFFHGTVSSSLPGIFAERGMLPSYEMRLRGMNHMGESADEQFGRRAISLTRDFNESWAYHRHSPMSLDTYPVVFGISAETASKVKTAGFLEPGEQLVDRLSLGSSWATRLGLSKQEITHVYVPDGKIPEVNRMLQAYRINGVSVVGINELPAPNWKPVPKFQDESEADSWLRSMD